MDNVIYFVNDENTYIQDGVIETRENFYHRNNTYFADCNHDPLIYIYTHNKIYKRIGGQKTRHIQNTCRIPY